jgi:hypothetical protein
MVVTLSRAGLFGTHRKFRSYNYSGLVCKSTFLSLYDRLAVIYGVAEETLADRHCTAYILVPQIRECIFSLQRYVSKESFILSAEV